MTKKIVLYNTLSRKKEEFIPIHKDQVKMYVCGPTVYDNPHLGNALAVVVYDLLYRIFIHIYGKENITYARNLTDVDDKINNAAKERNITIQALTEEITKIFHADIEELLCLPPTIEPKATEHIDEMIKMIELLLKNNCAYEADGHIYFSVRNFKEYGKLSGRDIDDLIAGSRIEVAEQKRAPEDFVLWKPAGEEYDTSSIFDSPFGKGRPGWHIECSAMSTKYLGADFDVHGGGVDLLFPHHTNEIAQSRCAYEGSHYAKYWVHNGFLTVNGEKMSKSLGNFITTREVLKSGVEGEIIRFHLLSTHYRKPMDWNNNGVQSAKKALNSFYRAIEILDNADKGEIEDKFLDALCDDMNTPVAYALLHEYLKNINKATDIDEKKEWARKLKGAANLMGFLTKDPASWFKLEEIDEAYINELIQTRLEAKKNKNFATADKIRKELLEQNIALEDLSDGTTKWNKL